MMILITNKCLLFLWFGFFGHRDFKFAHLLRYSISSVKLKVNFEEVARTQELNVFMIFMPKHDVS